MRYGQSSFNDFHLNCIMRSAHHFEGALTISGGNAHARTLRLYLKTKCAKKVANERDSWINSDQKDASK